MKKAHLSKPSHSRSVCRYSARPSRRVLLLGATEFAKIPEEQRCAECQAKFLRLTQVNTLDEPLP